MSDEQEILDAETEGDGLARFALPLALIVGCLIYFGLSRLFGVVIEEWHGVETFNNINWFGSVAAAPILSGFVTGFISGHGGKWYAMLPLGLIHPVEYFLARTHGGGMELLGFPIFVFLMLVMLELALMAGWGAEVLRMRMAGRHVRA